MELSILNDTYSEDEYICGLAAAQTPCFGLLFERTEKICLTCPLVRSCQEKYYTNLRQSADAVINRRTETRPRGDIPNDVIQRASKPESKQNTQKFEAFAGTICCVCGSEITEGTEANFNIRDGMFHNECAVNYRNGVRHGK